MDKKKSCQYGEKGIYYPLSLFSEYKPRIKNINKKSKNKNLNAVADRFKSWKVKEALDAILSMLSKNILGLNAWIEHVIQLRDVKHYYKH